MRHVILILFIFLSMLCAVSCNAHDSEIQHSSPIPTIPHACPASADMPVQPLQIPPEPEDPAELDQREKYSFLASHKYPQLLDTAFRFFKAYMHADITAAKELTVSPEPACLSYFSTQKRSLDSVSGYVPELVSYAKSDEEETAHLDIRFILNGQDMAFYMCISFIYCSTEDTDGTTIQHWKVTNFDFDA